ncbi:MAG: M42 family metallopeptidase [Verrucomicrobiales bacterium]|nr:M42 family metallopeptidase [Verrucomicrobiales bacterium]
MDPSAKEFLFDLLRTPSPTGFEIAGQRKWAAYAAKFADSVAADAYGNAWASLAGKGDPAFKLMLEAHADEIGYMVKTVTSEGFLYLERIGGSDHATGRGRKLDILGDKGPVRGIIGNTAIHIRDRSGGEKAPEVHELYVDVGADNAKDVAKLGIRVGHPAVYSDTVEEFGPHRLTGRALDNRIGGFIIAQVLQKLQKHRGKMHCTVLAVNAVQEEIGGFGARMVTHRLEPSAAICLDVTHATDTPGIDRNKHGSVKLTGGPSITHGTACHPNVVKRLMKVAEKAKLPLQHESSSRFTGTDTDDIYYIRNGVPTALVSLPLRYMHSVVECIDLRDLEQVVELLANFALSIKPGEDFGHKL